MPMISEQVCDRIGARVSSQGTRRTLFSRMDWIFHYLELVWILARKEIKVRYKNSFFGYLWSLVNPLTSAAVFYFAFEIVFKIGIPDFVIFVVIGLFVWQWTANYLIGSCDVYIANQNLIKKAVFPRFVLPIALNIQDAFHFLASVPVIVLLLWWHHVAVEPVILAGILLIVPAQFLTLLGLGFRTFVDELILPRHATHSSNRLEHCLLRFPRPLSGRSRSGEIQVHDRAQSDNATDRDLATIVSAWSTAMVDAGPCIPDRTGEPHDRDAGL